MSKIYVYMAGPITDNTESQANNWRSWFADELKRYTDGRIVGVSPLRCEPLHGDRYAPEYADTRFGTPAAISAKNKEDVRRCDITVAYIPVDVAEDVGHISIGTLCELNWAYCFNKPCILVSDVDYVRNNAVVAGITPWRFKETGPMDHGLWGLNQALDVIIGIYGVYSG